MTKLVTFTNIMCIIVMKRLKYKAEYAFFFSLFLGNKAKMHPQMLYIFSQNTQLLNCIWIFNKSSDIKYLYIYFSFLKIKLSSYVQRYIYTVPWLHYSIYLTDSVFSLPIAITGFRCSESTSYFQWLTVATDFNREYSGFLTLS